MVGVAGHAVAHHLRQDLGTASLGVLQALEHNHSGAFADHEAVARRAQTLPVAGDVVTDRCDRAETGDDDALETLHHGVAQACLS